jgi:hypothetical protein
MYAGIRHVLLLPFICFLERVYALFMTVGALWALDTRSMSTRYHERLTDAPGQAITRTTAPRFASGALEVNVIFTDLQATAAALKVAHSFARELGARIHLRAAVVVPFQLPLDRPAVSVTFLQGKLRKLVSQIEGDTFDPTIHLYFCRDRVRALSQVLPPNSLIVMGGRRHWWPTAKRRMARALKSQGHRVIFVDSRTPSGSTWTSLQRISFAR